MDRFYGAVRNRRGSPTTSIRRPGGILLGSTRVYPSRFACDTLTFRPAFRYIDTFLRNPHPLTKMSATAFGQSFLGERVRIRTRPVAGNQQVEQMLALAFSELHTPTGHAPVPRGEYGQ